MTKLDVFQRMHKALWDECMQGDIHFRIFSHLLSSLREKPGLYSTYMTFMGFTLDAHLACARLSLMKLSDRSGKATSLEKLHAYAKDDLSKDVHDGKIKTISDLRLKRALKTGDRLLQQLGDLPSILKDQRNGHFVHLSKKYAGDYYKVYEEFALTANDIKRLYHIAIEFLEEYQRMLPGISGSLAVGGIEYCVEDSLIKMYESTEHEDVPDELHYARFKLSDLK